MEWWMLVGLVILAGAGIGGTLYLLSNNIALGIIIVLAVVLIYVFIQWRRSLEEKFPDAYEEVRKDFKDQALKCKPRTPGCLYLSLDGLHHFVKIGKKLGGFDWTPSIVTIAKVNDRGKMKTLELPTETDDVKRKLAKEAMQERTKGWHRLHVIAYQPVMSKVMEFIWRIPVISAFSPVRLFLVADHQLFKGYSPDDIIVRGATSRKVYFFEMTDAPDLNPEYIGMAIAGETEIKTNEYVFSHMIESVGRGLKANPELQMALEILAGKPKGGHGISI